MWDALEWIAWAISAAIFIWMFYDAWRVDGTTVRTSC
jgi:hypothetical protein